MKKMNKMYEAPKAEVIELNVNRAFMTTGETSSDNVNQQEDSSL